MPTYDYRCRACGHRFEAFQSMTEKPIQICPNCGKPEVERLISAGGGFLFKGSGFYITDYRKDSYKKDSKKDSKNEPGESASSKPETKKDSGGDTSASKPNADSKPKSKSSE